MSPLNPPKLPKHSKEQVYFNGEKKKSIRMLVLGQDGVGKSGKNNQLFIFF